MNFKKMELVSVGYFNPSLPWTNSHAHRSYHEMIVIFKGHEHAKLPDNDDFRAGTGDVFLFPKGMVHDEWGHEDEPLESYFIAFKWDGYPKGLPLHVLDSENRVRMLTKCLFTEYHIASPLARQVTHSLLQSIVALYVRSTTYREDPLVTTTRQFIRNNYEQSLTLDILARQAGLSKYHFLRKYRRLTERTPMADVRSVRLDFAQSLLLSTRLPLKVIAPKVGLSDEYHLSRLFRKYRNASPGTFRKSQ